MKNQPAVHAFLPASGDVTRRGLLTLWSAGCVVSISGCGGGGEAGETTASADAGAPSSPAAKALPVTTEPGPAVAASFYDRGVSTSAMVTAAEGGTMALPGGETLIIPAGALGKDTRITVTTPTDSPGAGQLPTTDAPVILKYSFSPAGTQFSKPVILRRPLPALTSTFQVSAYASSGLNPLVDVGREKTNWQRCVAPAGLPVNLDIQLEHFTFVFAVLRVEETAYMVLDIPAKYLEVGDLVFTLTAEGGAHQWQPGHVAALVKSAPPFQDDLDDTIVEAGGTNVGKINLVFRTKDQDNFKFGFDHIYLGPRRALNLAGEGLNDEQKNLMVSFLYQQLGKGYAVIGDTLTAEVADAILPSDYFETFRGVDRYSCVSLVEAALRAAGHPLLGLYAHATFATPYEHFAKTRPIPQITVQVGDAVELPVYGVQLTPETVLGLAWLNGAYTRTRPYSVYAEALPPGARFDSVDLPINSAGGSAPGYQMTWTPQASDAGRTYKTKFHLTGDPLLLGLGPGVTQYLSFKVVGNRYKPTLLPIDGIKYQSVKGINRGGAILYTSVDSATGKTSVHILKGAVDRVVLSFTLAADTVLYLTNLNDAEHFGYALTPRYRDGPSQSYLYRDGVSVDLAIDAALVVRPLAINNNDEVVALTAVAAPYAFQTTRYRFVVSRDTTTGRKATPLSADLPEIDYVQKCIINLGGQVAIDAFTSTGDPNLHLNDQNQVWLVSNGMVQTIATTRVNMQVPIVPVFGDRVDTHLVDFNDAGVMLLQAADNRALQTDPTAQAIAVGLTWRAGVFKKIGTYSYSTQFGSYTASGSNAITDAGQVIGSIVYNADNSSAQFVEDLIDYTAEVPKGIPIPILSDRAQLSFVCANKVGQIVITLDIPQTGIPDRKTILALLTPA